jgi:diadenosine tetraphosphate (Ap4A) HIT family hydrolase
MTDNCEVCANISKPVFEAVFETKYWVGALNQNQAYLGTMFIALKRHAESLSDLTAEEWSDFQKVVKDLESAAAKGFGATMFNWTCLMNSFYKADEPIPHVHWHLRPRYRDAVRIDGYEYSDPNFAHHYDKYAWLKLSADEMKTIGGILSSAI